MPTCACRSARSRSPKAPARHPSASTTPPAPTPTRTPRIDVEKGLPRIRAAWVRERGGVEDYVGRDIKPEDNGNVAGKHLARDFPNKPQPLRGLPGKPVTQSSSPAPASSPRR